MKKLPLFAFTVLLLALSSSFGYSQDTTGQAQTLTGVAPVVIKANINSRWEYSVNVSGRKVSGYTNYHIQFPTNYYSFLGEGHSILGFPIDGYRMEVAGIVNLRLSKKDAIAFELAMGKAVSTPKEAQVDTDYIYVSAFIPPQWTFSVSTSNVRYYNYDLRFTVGYPYMLNKQLRLTTAVGFQTSHNSFDVVGLSGWWEGPYGTKHSYDPLEFAGVTVGSYKVDYHQLLTGLALETVSNKGMSLTAKGYFMPYVQAKDLDDHMLRFKRMTTDAIGTGYQLEGKVMIEIRKFPSGKTLSWGGSYSLLRISATGSQIQKYYADSPDHSYDETGIESDPIDNTIKLWQNTITVFIEYKPQ